MNLLLYCVITIFVMVIFIILLTPSPFVTFLAIIAGQLLMGLSFITEKDSDK